MGLALPGYRIRTRDDDDRDASEGEVCIELNPRPIGLMLGYQQENASFAPLGATVYRTGDVAMRDVDGYLTFVGRADDVFKASDYRVSPFELESALIEHAAAAEAAVVPAPDPTRTAMPKAYVSLAAGILADRDTALSIFRHVRDRRALQAGAADRVLRFAQDDLRQNPPCRAAAGRVGASEKRCTGKR